MAALRATNLLFTPAEERFDRIARLASRLLGTPMSLVTLVADDLQWFKAVNGLDMTETSRATSFCGHAILGEDTFVVGNAKKDPRFSDNPLVTDSPSIKAYAGHPLRTPDGHRIGTLCVMDRKPRKFSREQLEILRDLAAIAETEVERTQHVAVERGAVLDVDEVKRKAAIDGLTHLWNQAAVMRLLDAELARARRGAPTCVAIARARSSAQAIESPEGDAVMAEIAARIRRGVRPFDVAGYCGRGEYILVFSNCRLVAATATCERIRTLVDYGTIATPAGVTRATVSIGLAAHDAMLDTSLKIVAAADEALSRAEALGGNRVAVHAPAEGSGDETAAQAGAVSEPVR